MVVLCLSQQTNKSSKSMESVEITEDKPKENILKKQPPEVFYFKRVFKYFAELIGKHLFQSFFLIKLPETCNFI